MTSLTELFVVINGGSVTLGRQVSVNQAEESHLCQTVFHLRAVSVLNITQCEDTQTGHWVLLLSGATHTHIKSNHLQKQPGKPLTTYPL